MWKKIFLPSVWKIFSAFLAFFCWKGLKHPFLVQKRGGKFFPGGVRKHELGVGNYRQSGRNFLSLYGFICPFTALRKVTKRVENWHCKTNKLLVVVDFKSRTLNINYRPSSSYLHLSGNSNIQWWWHTVPKIHIFWSPISFFQAFESYPKRWFLPRKFTRFIFH